MKPKRIVDLNLLEQVRNLPCLACVSLAKTVDWSDVYENKVRSHPHHVKSVGSGGDDLPSNVMSLCQNHHIEIHALGDIKFAKKYSVARSWLVINNHLFYDGENLV